MEATYNCDRHTKPCYIIRRRAAHRLSAWRWRCPTCGGIFIRHMTIGPVTRPYRGIRETDPWGSGLFDARRDGGLRTHKGVDFIALPGDVAIAPISGVVKRHVLVYSGGNLRGLVLEGAGQYWPYYCKILYVLPCVAEGQTVEKGQAIGDVQDVARYWQKKVPDRGRMTNHVHLEVRQWIDAATIVERPT